MRDFITLESCKDTFTDSKSKAPELLMKFRKFYAYMHFISSMLP